MKFISQGTQYAISAIIAISKHPSDIISAAEVKEEKTPASAAIEEEVVEEQE